MRLPVTISKSGDEIIVTPSTGGLATGMSSVSRNRDSVWIGWPGIDSDQLTQKDKKQITQKLKKLRL